MRHRIRERRIFEKIWRKLSFYYIIICSLYTIPLMSRLTRQYDLVIAHDTNAVPAARRLAAWKRCDFGIDIVEALAPHDRMGALLRDSSKIVGWSFKRYIYRKCDESEVLTISSFSHLNFIAPKLNKKPMLIHNSGGAAKKSNITCQSGRNRRINICFPNAHSNISFLKELCGLIAESEFNNKVILHLFISDKLFEYVFGEFRDYLDANIVKIYRPMNHKEYLGIIRKMDIGLMVFTGNSQNERFVAPNRFFDLVECGIPFITTMHGDPFYYAKKYEIGWLAEPTPESIFEIVRKLDFPQISEMRIRTADFSRKICWESQIGKLIDDFHKKNTEEFV